MYFKGKTNHKGKGPPRTFVNVYSSELMGMEIQQQEPLPTFSASTLGDHEGMLDCGATASAGPDVAVRGLIQAVLSQDKAAIIEIDKSARPYFRYGNGKWGRAWYRVHISSMASGSLRKFSIYALPNPPDMAQPRFTRAMLVPILVGMDHLGDNGAALMVDFNTGMALNTLEENPQPYQLRRNHKGHCVMDIKQYLTGGNHNHAGHATIRVVANRRSEQFESRVLEFHPVVFMKILKKKTNML